MAREDVTTQPITRAGLAPEQTAPTVDGDVIDVGRTALYVTNVGASAHDVTVRTPPTQDGLALAELVVSVAAGATVLIGPFPARTFGQPVGSVDAGRAYVDYETPADCARAVVSL